MRRCRKYLVKAGSRVDLALQIPLFQQSIGKIDEQHCPATDNRYFVPLHLIGHLKFRAQLLGGRLYHIEPRDGLIDKVVHGLEGEEAHHEIGNPVLGAEKSLFADYGDNEFYNLPNEQKAQGESRSFYPNAEKKAKREEAGKFQKIGEDKFEIGKYDGNLVIIGINKSQYQGDRKNKKRRNACEH